MRVAEKEHDGFGRYHIRTDNHCGFLVTPAEYARIEVGDEIRWNRDGRNAVRALWVNEAPIRNCANADEVDALFQAAKEAAK